MEHYQNEVSADNNEELLDVLDEEGKKTGQRRRRASCHKLGLPHSAVHIWIINYKGEVLLQKRSHKKSSYPSCWDVSSAGHIPAGETLEASAIRELEEELGLKSTPDFNFKLEFLFSFREQFETNQGKHKEDERISVFGIYFDEYLMSKVQFTLQEIEVEAVKWVTKEEMFNAFFNHDPSFVSAANPQIILDLKSHLNSFYLSKQQQHL